MGRGLSELQKTILRVALEKHLAFEARIASGNDYRGFLEGDTDRAQVLMEHFGWEQYGGDYPRQVFDFLPEEIGREKYRAGQAALSRAIRRLIDRGLLDRMYNSNDRRGATMLSEAGAALAKTLSVKLDSHDAELTDRESR